MFEKYLKRIVALVLDAALEHLEDRLKERANDDDKPADKVEPG